MEKQLTIITVTYNCSDLIGHTLDSILRHKPAGLEYIVIDGASTDGTLEVLNQYAESIDTLISEPDQGIYDAMNKGLEKASASYVYFINAGDLLYDEDTVDFLLETLTERQPDVLYGETMLVDAAYNEIGTRSEQSSRKLPKALNWKSLQRGMVVSHQSFIVKRSLAPKYDLRYHSSADIDWVIQCLKNSKVIINSERILSRYLTGGFSKQRHSLSLRERYQVLQHHYGFLPNLFNHLIILLRMISYKAQGKALN